MGTIRIYNCTLSDNEIKQDFSGSKITNCLKAEFNQSTIHSGNWYNCVTDSGYTTHNGTVNNTCLLGYGNVGIGTASPDLKLNIIDANANSTWESVKISNSNTVGSGLSLDATTGNGERWSIISNSSGGGANQYNLGFHKSTNNSGVGGTGYKMTLQHDGKVGIGVTDPDEKLHIASAGKLKLSRAGNDRHACIFVDNSGLRFTNDGGDPFHFVSAAYIDFWSCGCSSRAMRINGEKVGIGTDSPQYGLDVANKHVRAGCVLDVFVCTGTCKGGAIRFWQDDNVAIGKFSNDSKEFISIMRAHEI